MSGALKINPDFEYTTQRYPSDLIINDQTDYIRFQFYEYQPPFHTLSADKKTNYFETDGKRASYYGLSGEGNIGRKIEDDILMYMPQDVSTSMSTSWGGKEITNTAALALRGYANLTTGGDIAGAIKAVGSGVPGFAKGLPSSVAAGLVNMGLNATGVQTNLGINDILGGTAGVITNPNTEMLFGGPSIRNIGFKFKMAARSEREAKNMLTICRRFQYHASAKFSATSPIIGGVIKGLSNLGNSNKPKKEKTQVSDDQIFDYANSNNFIGVPDLCLFKYMTGNNVNTYLNQYKACALTNVDVNFTPDGSYSTLVGGYPSAVELTVGLVETKIIYQGEIDTNYKGESN